MHNLSNAKRIHCIGIGGIGISATAKLLVAMGKAVSGSDTHDSEIVRAAAGSGVATSIGNDPRAIVGVDLVIYSEAVPIEDSERRAAHASNIPEMSNADALAELTSKKRLIAIAGTNGKSTTTAIAGALLIAGGLDPTVIVGSNVSTFPHGNFRAGNSDWFVLEADEYQAKLLRYSPEIALITNIEEDHLDFYHDIAHIRDTFGKFLERVSKKGKIFLNADDERSMGDLPHRADIISYGIAGPADYIARNLEVHEGRQWFRLDHQGKEVGEFSLQIPGRFNVSNAVGALAIAFELGISVPVAQAVLESFPGIWRRFEQVGSRDGAIIISDYGHHPSAIKATLEAARDFYEDRRIVLVFQPHHHHRTRALFRDFVTSFVKADVVIVSEIYSVAGREEGVEKMSSQEIVDAVKELGRPSEVYFGGSLEQTEAILTPLVTPNDLVIFMGAGSIDGLARKFCKE